MQNAKVEEFLKLYAQLENGIRQRFDVPREKEYKSSLYWAENQPGFPVLPHVLQTFRRTRNLLDHPESCEGDFPVIPTDALISVLKEALRTIDAPKRAEEIGVRFGDICCASMNDRVLPIMRIMEERSFTHIPILEDKRVIGIFSENTLLSHMIRNEISLIDDSTTFEEMAELLPIEAHASETFGFIARNALAAEVSAKFQASFAKGERLGMLFVTANGKPNERLLGIITAWDAAALL